MFCPCRHHHPSESIPSISSAQVWYVPPNRAGAFDYKRGLCVAGVAAVHYLSANDERAVRAVRLDVDAGDFVIFGYDDVSRESCMLETQCAERPSCPWGALTTHVSSSSSFARTIAGLIGCYQFRSVQICTQKIGWKLAASMKIHTIVRVSGSLLVGLVILAFISVQNVW